MLVAGGWDGGAPLHAAKDDSAFEKMMASNVDTAYRALRSLLPAMVERKHGGRVERKRIGGSGNPARVLHLPTGSSRPDTVHESDWLAERTEVFKTAAKDYKATLGGFT